VRHGAPHPPPPPRRCRRRRPLCVSRLFAVVLSRVSLGSGGDDVLEFAVLRVLIAFARCPTVFVGGECLSQVVKERHNVYFMSASGGNQLCTKLVIAPSSSGCSSS
jgi:brefeldin A-inhibited guanine nucleotide-exchange protein